MAVSASVRSMTIEPPEGSGTTRLKIRSICASSPYFEKSGTRSRSSGRAGCGSRGMNACM